MPRTVHHPFLALVPAGLLLVGLLAPLEGQAPARTTHPGSGLWSQFIGNYHFSSRWGVLVEGQIRRANFAAEPAQSFVRGGLTYDVIKSPHAGLTLGAGYSYQMSYPHGYAPAPYETPEQTAWQQAIITADAGQVRLLQRFRLEERWIGAVAPRSSGDWFVEDWLFRWRIRSQLKATIPFHRRPIRDHDIYGVLADEVFVGFGARVGPNLFDQNRVSALLGWQLPHGFRIESGYLNQVAAKPDGHDVELNHILVVSLLHTAKLY